MRTEASMETLFVAIASYRDPECQWTVKDLFEAAAFPERIFVGICWQFDHGLDQDCFAIPYPRPDQVRVANVTLQETRGACWAKSRALSLIQGEDYILLIDSHMRFAANWDVEMINTLQRTDNPSAFLSTFPAGYEPPDKRSFSTPRLAPARFFDRIMSQNSVLLDMPRPLESYQVAGGYLFGRREMFAEVPYDPHIYFIGEEISHAARFFTHGWDGYAPDKCLIHHYYTRTESTKHWDDHKEHWGKLNTASYRRVRHLLGIERTSDAMALEGIEEYGLGHKRTLAEFQAAIGVNFNAQVIDRSRHETLPGIEAGLANPVPPKSLLDMPALALYASRHGYFLLPRHDAYIGKSLIHYGEWTEGINQLCAGLFSAGDTIVEIGAGFGARTIPLARLVGAEGKLIAVEQSRQMVDLLHANAVLSGLNNIQVVHVRMTDLPGMVEVIEPSFEHEGNTGMVAHRPANGQDKNLVAADQLDRQYWGSIAFLYVDTPGETASVLTGAIRMLKSQRPVVVVNADNQEDANMATEQLIALGYRLWWFRCPFFNADNFFQNRENLFNGYVGNCLVALPDDQDISAFGANSFRESGAC